MGGQPYFLVEKVFLRNTLLSMLRRPLICPGKSNSKYDVHDGSDDHDDTYDT